MKVVINNCFGGFWLSDLAKKYLGVEKKFTPFSSDNDRADPKLVECVEFLGKKANVSSSELKVVEIPDKSYFYIADYDGMETLYYSKSEIHEVRGND